MNVNFPSMSAVDIARELYGPGAAEAYRAQEQWVALSEAMDQADVICRQALGNARAGYKGQPADAAVARLSPFGEWSDAAGTFNCSDDVADVAGGQSLQVQRDDATWPSVDQICTSAQSLAETAMTTLLATR